MKVGFNMLLWTTHVTDDDLPLFESIKKAGYDGVEIPIFTGDTEHFEKVGKAIKDNGLGCTSVTVIPDEEHNPISPDAANRKAAVDRDYQRRCGLQRRNRVLDEFQAPRSPRI